MISLKKFKVARRVGAPIFDKCHSGKWSAQKLGGKRTNKKQSDYSAQLTEKQKVRYFYNVSEKQFKNYVLKSMKTLTPQKSLFEMLEQRLDNVVYRIGFAPTRQAARQMVSHGHVCVNGRRVDIASFRVSHDDEITFRENSRDGALFEVAKSRTAKQSVPAWLQLQIQTMSARVTGIPAEPDQMLQFSSVIEFYSR